MKIFYLDTQKEYVNYMMEIEKLSMNGESFRVTSDGTKRTIDIFIQKELTIW